MPSLPEIARALRGKIMGQQVIAPGPGHSTRDRSLSVRLSEGCSDGFIVFSHAGDDWRACRDHVAAALGLPSDRWRDAPPPDPAEVARRETARRQAEVAERAETERQRRRAMTWWNEAQHPADTLAATYLREERGLCWEAVEDAAGHALRFHPACPFGEETMPALVALIRDVQTGEPIGLHRTALTPEGKKLGRKVYGSSKGGAIMLDDPADVASGLTVGEGIETCLSARLMGLRPVWALVYAANVGALPVLSGVEALTVLGERDPNGVSDRECRAVGTRWREAGRAVDIVLPITGKDMNDALRSGVTA